MNFKLVRFKQNAHATMGALYDETGARVAVILERPWIDADSDGRRDHSVSRIAAGSYRAIRARSPKRGYDVWWLCDVPDVSSAQLADASATTCQIHKCNFPWELEGCLGIGTAFGFVEYSGNTLDDSQDKYYPRQHGHVYAGITGSSAAFDRFMSLTRDETQIRIEIVEDFDNPDNYR